MPEQHEPDAAGETPLRRLHVFNGGFLTQKRVKRILALAGYRVTLGWPGAEGLIGIWGDSPTAHRGLSVAKRTGATCLYVEDAFLRSALPARVSGEPPLGLCLDTQRPHFDPAGPSDLEDILAGAPLDDTALLNRARDAITRIREGHLTKYSGFDPLAPAPAPGYVLVIDQTRDDASVRASNGTDALFREMLVMAQEEHPGARIVIKSHPETLHGQRAGYYSPADANDRVTLLTDAVSPWALFEGAVAVYTLSSQLGFEAILAGHRPRVFGQPFYAGWSLTVDQAAPPRRQRRLTRAQLFAGAMMLYPRWYDPFRDRLCPLEDALATFETRTRQWREDNRGWTAHGMRMWKRKPLQSFFGAEKPIAFDRDLPDRPAMVWGQRDGPDGAVRVEDGFLRSRGLGAELVPPLSLVTDDLGIYYDPTQESRLERMVKHRAMLRPDQEDRARRLVASLTARGVSKYNLSGDLPELPPGRRILVPGQVEDDMSIVLGAGDIATNAALLEATRAANPDAVILYKPHPDVVAGLRVGAVADAATIADMVIENGDIARLLDQIDEVWTMTSLTGFEALIRGKKVVTFGAPFYAGWGLTEDRGRVPARRGTDVALLSLVHAALIDYPRYHDPVTNLPCPVEVALERLATGEIPHPGAANRLLSKLQGLLASRAHLWR